MDNDLSRNVDKKEKSCDDSAICTNAMVAIPPDVHLEHTDRVDLDPWVPAGVIDSLVGTHAPVGTDETDGVAEVEDAEETSSDDLDGTFLSNLIQQLKMDGFTPTPAGPPRLQMLPSMDLSGVAKWILAGKAKKIIVMAGAGISVSAGIPDFRTPGTGLYSNLEKYNLPTPQSIFDINYFREHPQAFYTLVSEMHPEIVSFRPTPTHFFIHLLEQKGLLQRAWTQNIDSLETQAGVSAAKLVAAHGNFDSATCITTGKKVDNKELIQAIKQGEHAPGGWRELEQKHGGLVKPDIVFFGESLPERFHSLLESDFQACDLLLVMGTSLNVQPFASLLSRVGLDCPRVLVNRERVGVRDPDESYLVQLGLSKGGGFVFDGEQCYRDVFAQGDCDAGSLELVRLLGWEEDFKALMKADVKALSP